MEIWQFIARGGDDGETIKLIKYDSNKNVLTQLKTRIKRNDFKKEE